MRLRSDHLLAGEQVVVFGDLPVADQVHDLVRDRRADVGSEHHARAGALGIEGNDPVDSPGPLEGLGYGVRAVVLDGEAQSEHGGNCKETPGRLRHQIATAGGRPTLP